MRSSSRRREPHGRCVLPPQREKGFGVVGINVELYITITDPNHLLNEDDSPSEPTSISALWKQLCSFSFSVAIQEHSSGPDR